MKLDSLDKKPQVYSIAWLSAAALAATVLLLLLGSDRAVLSCCLLLTLFFLAVTLLLLRAFRLQIRYNLYSYNTIIYFGFALFTLFISLIYGVLYLRFRRMIGLTAFTLLGDLLGSAKSYSFFTLPFLLAFSLGLIVSNLALIRREGFRPVNLLGVLLALLLLGGEGLIFGLDYYVTGSQTEVMLHDMLTNLMAAVYLYVECMMIGTIVAGSLAARYEPEKRMDYLIVLGCAIRRDGTPTPLLRGRLDRALAFARAQAEETGKAPVLVLSGGQGSDECISEAECMRRYLAVQGVPEEQMLLEDRSTDTAENMAFSKALIFARDPKARIAFSTDRFHVFRSGIKARQVKMRAQGMGCHSKWYFWPNAAVREFIGLLTQHRRKQGLILGGLVLFYVVMTLIYYNL